jgi:hypothetical protein
MKKVTFLFLSGLLAMSVAACGPAKTSNNAPDTTTQNNTTTAQNSPNVDKPTAQTNQNDAVSETRRKQLNADIRAREQRNQAGGDQNVRDDNDLKSEVRSKLEANLPASALSVDAKDGKVTVTGTVVDENQLRKIGPLAREIKGVKSVEIKASTNTAAKPAAPNSSTANITKDQTNRN